MDFGLVTRNPIRFFELADQSWFPGYIRGKIQEMLTNFWTRRIPFIQTATPAELAASVVSDAVSDLEKDQDSEVVVVDFCSGGGGPVPTIERVLNTGRRRHHAKPLRFVLTDLYPHVEAWRTLKAESSYINYVSKSVDACNAPAEVVTGGSEDARVFRLFCLSFHHFDDRLAKRILDDSMAKSDGFA
ncbi:MAG: hypothetical protein M1816_003358 [Peltula sp. TS41687]|nr:MAG: hypothetical protein M1816_003358 [Peltula sp. TS41687]